MPISEVHLIDCMEFMRTLPDKFFDICITDPPYGIGVAKMAYTQEENRPCRQKNGNILKVKKLSYKHGDWDNVTPDKLYFDELKRISKEQIIWGVEYYDYEFGKGRIKWDKGVPDGVSFKRYEYAYCSYIDNEVLFEFLWAGFCQAVTSAYPFIQQGNKKLNEHRIHPTQKPVALYKWLLKNYAKPGDKIFDSHMGSQSSRIACYDGGFDYWGCELDEDYFRDGCKRFKNHIKQLTIPLI